MTRLSPFFASAAFVCATLTATHAQETCFGDDLRIGICVPGQAIGNAQSTPVETTTLTDAELAALPRDERRTKIIEGFTCETLTYGQAVYIKYLPGGRGVVGHHEGDVDFNWSVENDQLCITGWRINDKCSSLPKRDIDNEREVFLTALSKNCL